MKYELPGLPKYEFLHYSVLHLPPLYTFTSPLDSPRNSLTPAVFICKTSPRLETHSNELQLKKNNTLVLAAVSFKKEKLHFLLKLGE